MEIEQMRGSSHPHQLDWRWVQRYRELDAYDAYWWWAHAGPFTIDHIVGAKTCAGEAHLILDRASGFLSARSDAQRLPLLSSSKGSQVSIPAQSGP